MCGILNGHFQFLLFDHKEIFSEISRGTDNNEKTKKY